MTLHKGVPPILGEFDRAILDWFDEKRSRGIIVSNEDIKREGRAIARKLHLDNFKVSVVKWKIFCDVLNVQLVANGTRFVHEI